MQQFFKADTDRHDDALENTATQGFVSREIFKTLLLIGLFCSATGFLMDLSIQSMPRIVTIMTALLFAYLSCLLLLSDRIGLHINMRLAFTGLLVVSFLELIFDESGMLWSITLPPVAFAAFGKKEGFAWSAGNFTLIVAWLIWDSISASHFSSTAITNITLTYILITLVSYFYTSHIDRTHHLILQHTREQERLEIAQTLSGGIAHLINNEMQAIIGSASLLKMQLHEPDHRQKTKNIIDSAFKSSSHANQLLAYAEHTPEYMQDHDLTHMLRSLSETWLNQLPEGIQLQLQLPEQLPTCHCDSKQIQNALNILFENATEACQPKGLIELQASTAYLQTDLPMRQLKKGHYIKISIRDDGMGIKSSELDKIFEPFFSTKFTGRGLGLPAAHGIIKRHGGELHVHSSEGKGAVFTVFLPVPPPA
ncbi:MAG: ATP-binding protein [Mariprofundus sp.]|nr:ATP-binding protein [Mariprofundus sp.]